MMSIIKKQVKEKLSTKEMILLGVGLVTFAVLTLVNISRWSIWFDEAFSSYLLRYNMADIARYTATDVHPPLYYWLLKAWSFVFGESIVALRSLSLVFIVAAIALAFFFVRQHFGKTAAAVATVFMAISPMLIRYSEEARMYGLVVLIATAATIVLVEATLRPSRRKWLVYGLLVSLGMWTHYFTAIIWLSHWIWRLVVRGQYKSTKRFFSRDWIIAHVFAIALYLPWLPFMVKQMVTVQFSGFWIQDVTINSLTNMLTNTFVFREHADVKEWLAVLVFGTIVFSIFLIVRARQRMTKSDKPLYDLLLCMSVVPVLLLFVASLPPLRPSYVERYLLTAALWSMMLLAVSLVYGLKGVHKRTLVVAMAPFVLCMVIGITNVYHYGNFNRNGNEASTTKEAVDLIQQASPDGQPILAESPWRFYEAIYYDSPAHPVYFQATDDATYGSYDMLRYSDYRKIQDIEQFAKAFPRIWYIGTWQDGKPHTPEGKWMVLDEIVAPTPVKGSGTARAFQLEYLGA